MRSSGVPLGFNWGQSLGQRLSGKRLDPYMAFNFAIEIEGLLSGNFSEASGLEGSVEVEPYQEGGVNDFIHHLPRQATYPNLVLTHGLSDLNSLWNWYYNVTQGIIERKNGTIALLNKQLIPVMWWNFRNAIPVKWTGPQFHAANSAVAFETIELVHEGLTKPLVAQGLALAHGAASLAGEKRFGGS
jgi:phage tail-like protein